MFDLLKNLLHPPEQKASRTARLIALEGGGRARWTPRDYAALAREGFLCNAIVHRAVKLVAENAAACTFLVYEGAVERDRHPLADLLARPNPRQGGAAFFEALHSYLLLAGNAYVEAVAIDGPDTSAVRELYALRPDRMRLVPGPDGWAEAYDYTAAGRTVRFDQNVPLPPILHLTAFHPLDDHYGLSSLEAAAVAVEGGNGDLRWKMSKETAADTLSMLFQDNYSGRAEIGLTGDDNFHLKVSADGSTWLEAIVIDRSTGKLSLGQGVSDAGATRTQLAAAPFDALACNNVVVNPAVDVSQELGTTGATLASGTAKYVADCFEAQYVHGAGTAVVTSAQLAAASFPSALAGFKIGHQIKATTAITSPASGDYARHRTKIEGYRIAHWGWGASGAASIVVAFEFYSTASGTAFVKLSNSDQSRCYYHEITVAAGWNFNAFTVAGDTGGTWQATTSTGLTLEVFSSGKETTPASSLDAWGSTNKVQTTNSTNLLGTNNNLTILTGVFVAAGTQLPVAADLPKLMRTLDQDLPLCERYWFKSYSYSMAPGTGDGPFSGSVFVASDSGSAGGNAPFSVRMRAVPSVTIYGSATGTSGKARDQAGSDLTSSATDIQDVGFNRISSSSLFTAGHVLSCHYVANARL